MADPRPNPDALLALVSEEDRRAQRGKLKVFLGACAGVGKTFAMLEAAKARKNDKLDTIIGVVETHGRKETEALLGGLEILPQKSVVYHNVTLKEFDLDGALKRRPQWILVDELAHTNAPEQRHLKRWQDIKELLDNGINVYTTVNIQHLESLNDLVAQITGVIVRETIPDSVLEEADEVELVDLPPADLLKRLREGRVYFPEQAQRAQQNFFKEDRLAALRELALRYTAEKVNQQVQSFRAAQQGGAAWPTKERILVCVGPSPSSARLIRATKRLADTLRGEWIALHVETPASLAAPQDEKDRVIEHLRLAEKLGAETVTISGSRLSEEAVAYARSRNVSKIVVGKPIVSKWRQALFGTLVDELIRRSTDMDVYVIRGGEEDARPLPSLRSIKPHSPGSAYGLSIAVAATTTAVCFGVFPYTSLTNLVMIYLLGVVFVASRVGRGPSILSSFLSVAAFDLFFVPPRFSLAVTDMQYVVTFAVMLLVALVVSTLTVQVRQAAETARLRERRTASLHALSRTLASTSGSAALLEAAVQHIAEVFDSSVVALLPDARGKLAIRAGKGSEFAMNSKEQSVAQWAHDLGQIAGMGTDTLPTAEALYVPLLGTQGPAGALGVKPKDPERLLIPDQLRLLEAFANQTALALERDRLAEASQQQTVEIETERLRGSLLSSVSHDLRTPLTSISGAASSLIEQDARLDEQTKRELLHTIFEESERLGRQVGNLLEMTRLEAGTLKVTKELQPLEEALGAAMNRLEKILSERKVETKFPIDLPLVPADAVLLEQVFFNLVENAAKYTPLNSPIEVSAKAQSDAVLVEIADRGPGLGEGEEERIFDKFYRGAARPAAAGTGLGLSICKGIVRAHGGKIWAENRPGGGTIFRFTLPLDPPTTPVENRHVG